MQNVSILSRKRRILRLTPRRVRRHHVLYGARLRYPWESMEIGDFFDIPQVRIKRGSLMSAAGAYARTHDGYAFASSSLINRDGIPVWRVVRIAKPRNWFNVSDQD